MVSNINVSISADNPQTPLRAISANEGSAISLRITGVPQKVGEWEVAEVHYTIEKPDRTIVDVSCVKVGDTWVGSAEGLTATPYTAYRGFTVWAKASSEKGGGAEMGYKYILGIGDYSVLTTDNRVMPAEVMQAVNLVASADVARRVGDAWWGDDGTLFIRLADGTAKAVAAGMDIPSGYVKIVGTKENAVEGYLYKDGDKWEVYHDGNWDAIGGGGGGGGGGGVMLVYAKGISGLVIEHGVYLEHHKSVEVILGNNGSYGYVTYDGVMCNVGAATYAPVIINGEEDYFIVKTTVYQEDFPLTVSVVYADGTVEEGSITTSTMFERHDTAHPVAIFAFE